MTQLVSIANSAKRLDVTERHILRQIKAGRLPVIKLGRRTLIEDSALAEYVAANRQTRGVAHE